jgi:hypothetical protein
MKAFIGLLGRSASLSFLVGDVGGERNESGGGRCERSEGDGSCGGVPNPSGGKLNLQHCNTDMFKTSKINILQREKVLGYWKINVI